MINTSQPAPMPMSTEPAPRLRLHYLDGLRGLAALVVAFTHAFYQSGWQNDQSGGHHYAFAMIQALSQGRAAVAIFIVLSGYCLMLPVARSADQELKGGTINYLKRRMRRILPPYYAALVIISSLIFLLPTLKQPLNVEWSNALPALTLSALSSHILLVQNLNKDWLLKIDPPMWSVATEWQIYFIFPLLLLPVWRRFGNGITILSAFALACVLIVMLHSTKAAPWFIGLFALGMVAAVYSFSNKKVPLLYSAPWGVISGVLFAAFGFVVLISALQLSSMNANGSHNWLLHFLWATDVLVGLATAALLVFCTRYIVSNRETKCPCVLSFFESSPLVKLGFFSYSLYLVHDPLLAITCDFLQRFHLPPPQMFGALVVLGLPIALIGAYLFHLAFERRFMGAPKP